MTLKSIVSFHPLPHPSLTIWVCFPYLQCRNLLKCPFLMENWVMRGCGFLLLDIGPLIWGRYGRKFAKPAKIQIGYRRDSTLSLAIQLVKFQVWRKVFILIKGGFAVERNFSVWKEREMPAHFLIRNAVIASSLRVKFHVCLTRTHTIAVV